jgi:hypothetical protein
MKGEVFCSKEAQNITFQIHVGNSFIPWSKIALKTCLKPPTSHLLSSIVAPLYPQVRTIQTCKSTWCGFKPHEGYVSDWESSSHFYGCFFLIATTTITRIVVIVNSSNHPSKVKNLMLVGRATLLTIIYGIIYSPREGETVLIFFHESG